MTGEGRPAYPKVMALVRLAHIYLTLFALLMLLFFGTTGYLLNHAEWFGLDDIRTSSVRGAMSKPLADPPDKLAVVEELRAKLGSVGGLDSFESEPDRLRVVFKKPALRTEVLIEKPAGSFEAQIEARGLLAIFTDLHRGQGTGAGWKWLIDITSLSLLAAALTGLVLWTSLPRRRRVGLASLALGIGIFFAAYFLLVP